MAAKRVRKPFSTDIRRTTTVFVSSHVPQECPQYAVPSSCYPIRPVNHEQFVKKPKMSENRHYLYGNRYIVPQSCIMCWRCGQRGHIRHECTAPRRVSSKRHRHSFSSENRHCYSTPSLLRTFQMVANIL